MNRKGDKSLIVGLDIGTSKVTALVGEYAPGEPIEVIGIGSHESRGLRKGVVVDIDSTVQSIQRAVEEAELMAGCEVRSVYASISGNHVQCRNSQGIAPIRDGEVSYGDLDRVLEAAKAVAIPADQRILHAIPRDYVRCMRTWWCAHNRPPPTSPSACRSAACRSTTWCCRRWRRAPRC
jgi:cell division protein FtsA